MVLIAPDQVCPSSETVQEPAQNDSLKNWGLRRKWEFARHENLSAARTEPGIELSPYSGILSSKCFKIKDLSEIPS